MEMISGYVEAHLHSDHTSRTPSVDVLDAEIKAYRKLRQDFLEKKSQYKKERERAKKQAPHTAPVA